MDFADAIKLRIFKIIMDSVSGCNVIARILVRGRKEETPKVHSLRLQNHRIVDLRAESHLRGHLLIHAA